MALWGAQQVLDPENHFKNHTIQGLKEELRKFGARLSGRKAELYERLCRLWQNRKYELKCNSTIQAKAPLFNGPPKDSYKDINSDSKIPPVTRKHIALYLKRFQKKIGSAESMYDNKFLSWVRYAKCNEEHFFRGCVGTEMKKCVSYYTTVKVQVDGLVVGAECECVAGAGPEAHCKHVIIVLLGAADWVEVGKCTTRQACTQVLQTFHKPKRTYNGSPKKAASLKSHLPFSGDWDPRPAELRGTKKVNERVHNLMAGFGDSTAPLKQLLVPANPFAVVADHTYSSVNPVDKFLEAIYHKNLSEEKILTIEKNTIGQHENPLWTSLHKTMITASKFFDVCKAVDSSDPSTCQKLAKSLLNPKPFRSKQTDHGILNEPKAVNKYMKIFDGVFQAKDCGIFIMPEYPYLGASPDRTLTERILLEVKCPYSVRDQLINPSTVPYLFLNDKQELQLKETHAYYYQVQGQLVASQREICHFIVYTYADLKVIYIERDDDFIAGMLQKLSFFYDEYYCPALLNKYFYRDYYSYDFPSMHPSM